ncbi:MAG TPA: ABC transporter permease [Gemmatimonadaceae bacterium]
MDTLLQDIRFAIRTIRKQRGTSAVAVVCLALGIGANTAIFSVIRTVLMDSLPFQDPGRIVRLYETANFGGTRGLGSVSVPDFLDWRSEQRSFVDIAAYSAGSADLAGDGNPERVRAIRTTANLFSVLGAAPYFGRVFTAGEDQPGHNPVVILSEGFWRRRFGGDRALLGKLVSLDNTLYTVVGVMPAAFDFPVTPIHNDVWIPLLWTPTDLKQRGNHWMSVIGRLKPGVDSAAATAQMATIAERIARDFPNEQKDRGVAVNTMNGVVVGRVRTPLLMLLGAVGLVLLISCANVANLLLARASGRRREVAIRTALGAERGRLVRQFLTESVLLAAAGGLVGLAVAHWGLQAILAYAAAALPRAAGIHLNGSVLAFAAGVSLLTGIAFGLVPALRASQSDLREDLSESAGRTGTSRKHHRTLRALIVAEMALSLVLLVGAGLLIRGFVALMHTDPGLRPDHVLTFHIAAPSGRLPDSVRYVQFYGPVLQRLRGLPAVSDAASTTIIPIQNTGVNGNFQIVGRPEETDLGKQPFAEFRVVSSNYFRTMGITMVRGREFSDQDAAGAPLVAIVNDEFVRRYFPNEDPIGKQILAWSDKPSTIVGVARSVRQVSLDQPPRTELYVAAAQSPGNLFDVSYVLRTQSKPESLMPSVRASLHDIAPDQPIFLVKTMDDVISDSLQSRKLTLSLLAIFASLALLLSAAGVYGVMSYAVSQRQREIGIRMALGARASNVAQMILSEAGTLAAIGLVIGLVAAALLTRVLSSMVYGVGTHDPVTFVAVSALLAAVALTASLVPALRAARIDPLRAMRVEG